MTVSRCVRRGRPGRIFLLAIVLKASIPSTKADELWDFIRVGKNVVKGPKWESRSGKALVEIRKDRIDVHVSYSDDSKSDVSDKLGYEAMRISGTLASDNSIHAKYIFLDTDANPVKLTGRYLTRDELQI